MTSALYRVSTTYDLVVLFEHPEWQKPLCEEVPWCDGRTLGQIVPSAWMKSSTPKDCDGHWATQAALVGVQRRKPAP
jgi:hypothetical protein